MGSRKLPTACPNRIPHGFETVPWFRWGLVVLISLATLKASLAATLSDPQVDAYNVRVGTETFAGLYKFTGNTLLVETAQAITNLGSDTIKFYLGPNTSGQSGVTRPANVTNLITLARDEPSYRRVFDMPFRHFVVWAYPIANPEPPFTDGNYSSAERAVDYRELYDLTRYLLTNYDNSGKTFYLGHWEGDGYLKVNNWTTNPSPAVITAMIAWLNNRQQAVDDAKRDTAFTNVEVYNYAEANRVRDAMLNGPNNNQRAINCVVPYVTNLDYLSYSSYDAENLNASDLYATLNYMQSMLPTNKAAVVPGARIWIGEYGWGGYSTAAQEPLNRAYIQRLLNWNDHGQVMPFILYWEMYDNEPGKNFCLIDSNDVKTASWYLQNYFVNDARLRVAQFKETYGRLPTDTEFVSLVSPLLDQPLPPPVPLALTNVGTTVITNNTVAVSGALAQGIYSDHEAGVWVFYGRQDGGTTPSAWEGSRFAGVNTNFNPKTFTVVLNNLAPGTNYFFRFYAANAGTSAWAQTSTPFTTVTINPSGFGSRLKVFFSGYDRGETLTNFPALVNLSTNLPGFSYRQFASPGGGDLRFTDADGWRLIPHEIDEWNTNGISTVWVNVPSLSTTNDYIWAYWGNPAATNPPAYTTNGAVWPDYDLVWHLEENGFPFADSTLQHPALTGTVPASAPGEIGRGGSFNGSSQFLDAGPVNLGDAFTLSAWVKLDPAAGNIQPIWANKAGGWNANGFALFVDSYQTTDRMLRLETGDGVGGAAAASATGAVSSGQWHLLTATIDRLRGAARLFVDGADVTQTGSAATDFGNTAAINLAQITNGGFHFDGVMDEARIESGVQSSDWIWASWMTVASNSTLQNYSAVTQQPPQLSIDAGGPGTLLTWPGSGVGFTLYESTNLTPPVVWTPATNQPVLTNGQWQITPPGNESGICFYRLESQ
jgi:Concanavalin A-like lectin/glucanases superfamily/Domain of unknown function (DUF2341)